MNKVFKKSLLFVALLCARENFCMVPVDVVQPPSLANWSKFPSKTAATVALISAGFFRLYSKNPVEDPQYTGDLRTLLDLKLLYNDSREYFKNWRDLVDSQIIGQKLKDKSVPVGDDGDKLQVRKKDCPPSGLFGYTDTYVIKTGEKTFKSVATLALMYHLVNGEGLYALVNHYLKKREPIIAAK